MAIERKKKTCSLCRTMQYIHARGMCRYCDSKTNRDKHGIIRRTGWVKLKRRKPTGEAKLFAEIWEEREHFCVNCKVYLGLEMRTFYFSHIKSKGANPELRLDKNNIQLLCMDCHHAYDKGTKEQYLKRKRS